MNSPADRRDNPPLHWTAAAGRLLVIRMVVGAAAASERHSVMPPAITQFDVISLLQAASPEWQPDADDPVYAQLGSYARYILDTIAAGRVDELAPAFTAIEQLHTDGDHWTREAATIGILEGIQNIASHRSFDLLPVTSRLGPVSLEWWNKLEDFWAGRRPTVA